MTFSRRMATLAAVVLIPVGIAGTSYLLTEDPEPPSVPSEVELDETQREGPQDGTRSPSPSATPTEEVVPRPSATEGSINDDDQDGAAEDDRDDRDDRDDGEAGGEGGDGGSDLDDGGGGDG
jgi:hypothetical protein